MSGIILKSAEDQQSYNCQTVLIAKVIGVAIPSRDKSSDKTPTNEISLFDELPRLNTLFMSESDINPTNYCYTTILAPRSSRFYDTCPPDERRTEDSGVFFFEERRFTEGISSPR